LDTAIGTPILEKAAVKAEVIRNFKDDKILVFKKKRRKQYRRTHGHRQNLTEVKIERIYPDKTIVPADELRFEVLAPVAVEKTAPAPAPKPRTAKAPKAAEPVEAKPAPKPAPKPKAKPKAKPAAKKAAAGKPKSPAKKTAK
jgi:large subunit ribosomal protein L21